MKFANVDGPKGSTNAISHIEVLTRWAYSC